MEASGCLGAGLVVGETAIIGCGLYAGFVACIIKEDLDRKSVV